MIDYQPEIRQQAVMRVNACQRFRWLMTRRNLYNTFLHAEDKLQAQTRRKSFRSD